MKITAVLSIIVPILFVIGFFPLMCMLAWNGFAWQFNLPSFTFWHWVAVVLAVKGLHGGIKVAKDEK